MARLSSQGAAYYIQTEAAPIALELSGATQAAPAVVTATVTTGITEGSFVSVAGTGWKSLDNRVFRAGAVDASTIELLGSDTTEETTTLAPTGATGAGVAILEVCVATFNRTSPPAATIDVTTLCDAARRKVPGIPDTGTFTLDGFYDAADAGYALLRDAYEDGDTRVMAIIMSDQSSIQFLGQITALSEALGVDQAVTWNAQGNVDGPVTYSPAPAP